MDCLPNEVIVRILKYLNSPSDIFSVRLLGHRFRDLIDHVTSVQSSFWKKACYRDFQPSYLDSVCIDPAFDRYFPSLSRPSIADLEVTLTDENFWKLVYIVQHHIVKLTPEYCCHIKPQSITFDLVNVGLPLVELHGHHVCAIVESSFGSQTNVVMAKRSPREASNKCTPSLKPIILRSIPGKIIFMSLQSGFPSSTCVRMCGPSIEVCPLCKRNPNILVGSKIVHLSVVYVHNTRGVEVIGICIDNDREIRPLPNAPQWFQKFRSNACTKFEIASMHKGILQVIFRVNFECYNEVFHFRDDCQHLGDDHCKSVFPDRNPRARHFNEYASVTIFRRNDEYPTDFMQASIDWGGRMGSGGITDDLRKVPNSIAQTKALHLRGQTLLLSVNRSETMNNSAALSATEYTLIERNLRVLNISTVKSVPLRNLCNRAVTYMASIGSTTVFGTDTGKVLVLRYGPQRLTTALEKFNLNMDKFATVTDNSFDEEELKEVVDNLVLYSCSTDGHPVTYIQLSLSPPYLQIVVCTGRDKFFLLQF